MKLKYFIIILIHTALVLFGMEGKNLQAQTDVNTYTKKCNYFWRVNIDSSFYYGYKAVNLADKETELSDETARAYMFLGVTYFYDGNYDSAIYYSEKGLAIAEQINSIWGKGFGNNMLTILMRKKGDYNRSLHFAEKTIALRKETKDTFNLAGAYNNKANTYNDMGDLENAIENMLLSLELRIKTNDTIGIIMSHMNISNTYLKTEEVTLAKDHIDKALILIEEGTLEAADSYIILGDIFHSNLDKPDTALALYERALSIYTAIGIDEGIAVANENIGNTLLDMGDVVKSLEHLRNARYIYEEMSDSAQIAHIYMSIGDYYRKTENYDSSNFYLSKALSLGRKISMSKVINETLVVFYLLNKEFNYFDKSLDYLEQLNNYNDSMLTIGVYDKMAILETKYKTAEKEKTIIQLKYEKERDRRHRAILYGTLIFIITLAIIIGVFLYFRRQKENQINEQKRQLLLSKKKLAETELEKQKIKEEDMKKDIEHKARQLSSHALHMMQKSKMLHEVKEKIDETIKDVDPKYRQNLRQIARLIDKNLRTEQEWELFKMYFEQVNSSFYTNLKKYNPDLSQTDIRMCSLMRLGLNMKESASVLNVAPNTVKNARYRVKQKLGLSGDESLSEFIETL